MRIVPTLAMASFLFFALPGCGPRPEPGIRVEYREVVKEVQRPCPVERPERPKPLDRPLPKSSGRLVDALTAKLAEWAGEGGYGEKADQALAKCTAP
jgi:hypothetical protein